MSRKLSQLFESPVALVVFAFLVRVACLRSSPIYRIPMQDHLAFGYEAGRIARSVVLGHGFSSPFLGPSGPTAWLGPIYPLLVAGVFKIFGIYTWASATVILGLNCVFAALTALVIYQIGKETLGKKAGLWAGWIFALLPFEIGWATRWVWDTSLSALLLSVVFLLTLRMEHSRRIKDWLVFGLLWGFICLTNPSLLPFLPASVGWLWYKQRRLGVNVPRRAFLAAVVCMVVLSPWVIRNYEVFGKFIPLRSNFGMELYLGNHAGANGMIMFWDHPIWNDQEMSDYAGMGELAYVGKKQHLALDYIKSNPREFAALILKRVLMFWGGVPETGRIGPRMGSGTRHAIYFCSSVLAVWGVIIAIRRRQRGAFLYTSLLVLYPLIYYITHNHSRYRHPMEPIMALLGMNVFVVCAQEDSALMLWWRKWTASPEMSAELGEVLVGSEEAQ